MTTLAELVALEPAPAHGVTTQFVEGVGVWRWVVELADPAAGPGVEWFDITQWCAGVRIERGADEQEGRYRACVATLELQTADDRFAPWNPDTSATFGTHVQLGAGLLIRAGLFRVAAATVTATRWRFTNRVEEWGDGTVALGQLRRHDVVTRDALTELVGEPCGARGVEGWYVRAAAVISAAGYPFGSTIYGARDISASPVIGYPLRDVQPAAEIELDASCDPVGCVWYTDRQGRIIVRPQPGDTWHADQFEAGATGTPFESPAPVVFASDGDPTAVRFVIDDPAVESFGIAGTENAVVTRFRVTDPDAAVYDVDDPVAAERHGRRTRELGHQVIVEQVIDDLLVRRAGANKTARPLLTDQDRPNFMQALRLDWLDPIRVRYQTAAGRPVVTADGRVRRITEEIAPLAGDDGAAATVTLWRLQVLFDLDGSGTSSAASLLPPEDLTASAITDQAAQFEWTDPTQPATPTTTQYRITEISGIWLGTGYPTGGDIFLWESLEPETLYTFEVRYVREVDGLPVAFSPAASVQFVTLPTPAPIVEPDGDGGLDVDLPDVGDCSVEWELQESDDGGATWTTIDSGTAASGTELNLGAELFDLANLYRVRSREVCDGVPGDWYSTPLIVAECRTNNAATAPFDDALVYVPEVCPPQRVIEAVSGDEAAKGSAFAGIAEIDGALWLASTSAGGVVAFDSAPALADLTGDRSLFVRFTFGEAAAVPLLVAGGAQLSIIASGADFKVAGRILFSSGSLVVTGSTALIVGSTYSAGFTYDASTRDAVLYLGGVEEDSNAWLAGGAELPGLAAWQAGLPPSSAGIDWGAWGRLLSPAELGAPPPAGHVGVAAWVADNAGKVLAYYPGDDAAASGTMSDTSGNGRNGAYGSGISAGSIDGETVPDYPGTTANNTTVSNAAWQDSITGMFLVLTNDVLVSLSMFVARDNGTGQPRTFQWRTRGLAGGALVPEFVKIAGPGGTVTATAPLSSDNAIPLGVTGSLGWTYDGTNFRHYVNGVHVSTTAMGAFAASAAPIRIGHRLQSAAVVDLFNGRVGSVVALNGADSADIAALHAAWTG